MENKTQVLVIHGGTTFDTYEEYINFLKELEVDIDRFKPSRDWKDNLAGDLGAGFEVLLPKMPNSNNSKYEEWKLWFEKLLSVSNKDVLLLGHSLGGIFLVKYLSENGIDKNVKGLFLVAPPYDTEDLLESLGTFNLTKKLGDISLITKNVFIYHSKDDPVVPFSQTGKYLEDLPEAKLRAFEDRGHLRVEHLPELVEDIKSL